MRFLRLLFFALIAGVAAAQTREADWSKVDEAMQQGLPETAIQRLEPIIQATVRDQDWPQAIKAITRKIVLQDNIQGNLPEAKIRLLQAEIEQRPEPMRPVLQAILANWYWHYFQQNQWRFLQRTETSGPASDDFTTWSLPQILGEIDKHFTRALAAKDLLRKIPVAQYDALLEKGTLPDAYRPTLYDVLAHNALEFYTAKEQAGPRAETAFDLMADGPIFAPVEEFLAWKAGEAEDASPILRAIRLYQELIAFHREDTDAAALLDADLARLVFGNNQAFGEERGERFRAALKRFTDQWGDHEIAARALHHWALSVQEQGNLVEARQLAQRGANAFPDTPGGRLCFNLVQDIEQPSSSISTERVWNEPASKVQVRYRNLRQVFFRAVRSDYTQRLKSARYRPENLDDQERQALLARLPAATWQAELPATEDFQERVEPIAPPAELGPGFYFLFASHRPDFREDNNLVSVADFWVSDLALVTRQRPGVSRAEGFVLQANSGEPLPGATVQAWLRARNGTRAAGPVATTDANGFFALPVSRGQSYLLHIRHGDRELAAPDEAYAHGGGRSEGRSRQTVFFTDRSLYRPGQTIHFKGICLESDRDKDQYRALPGQTVTVVLQDPNGEQVERRQQKTNDYGSFSGSFTAPRDRLTGRMTISVDGEPAGAASFNVEEYKRPKFRVALDPPSVAPRLDDAVTLSGKATAYTGAAIGDADVRWRVVRQVRYPIWWGWYYWWRAPREESQEIARGSVRTAADGSFQLQFTARPDRSISPQEEPVFEFSVSADVTDTTGETRSDERVVRVGYTAIEATLQADDWQTHDRPVQITIRTATLDGEAQVAEGAVKIYRLKSPARVQRAELPGQDPRPFASGEREGKEPQPDWSNPATWPLGEMVDEQGFTTDAKGQATVRAALPAGAYRAVLETQDRFGKAVTGRLQLTVLDPAAGKFPIRIPSHVAAPRWSAEPGEKFLAVWGSGYDSARAFVEVEQRGKLLQSYWTEPGKTQAKIEQAVGESLRGGFSLHVTMVRENRAYLSTHSVDVPWTNKDLTVRWEHFVSKLEPGKKETWTAVIAGPDAAKAVAEMVAALYDASLDAYLPHNWSSLSGVFRRDPSWRNSAFANQTQSLQHLFGGWPTAYRDGTITYRSLPAEIVANVWGYGFFSGGFGGGMGGGMTRRGMAVPMAAAAPPGAMADGAMLQMEAAAAPEAMPMEGGAMANRAAAGEAPGDKRATGRGGASGGPKPDLDKVSARINLDETAFFFPHLLSDAEGRVKLEFTMPEALTEWRFLGFAHDAELRSGLLTDTAVTAKDLMVEPNPPRFLREGDLLEFTVKVSNQSAALQTGVVRLTLADARTGESVDAALGNTANEIAFELPSKESRSYAWRLQVPDRIGFLTYKAVGATDRLADGEEGFLPVLSRRITVTESLPLPIRGPQTKQFTFQRLIDAGQSDSLQQESLTVQMVSNPAWYSVMALPYLMEFPHECTEQTFNRLYANALARHVANADPRIRRVFAQWKATPALDSPLEKNQDLKAVMLEETPWLRQARAESQARRDVGILFDENRLNDEVPRILRKLSDQQREDGAWPWFPGGPANSYITLYIVTGFGRLRHLGADVGVEPAVRALDHLDGWIDQQYREILKRPREAKDANQLSPTIALYLYGRSFFLEDQPLAAERREAVDYYLGQARKHWLQLADRQSQGHLAVALKRFGDTESARAIMRSIKERSVTDEELGRFWRELELSWWWYRAPIETQAMMIEAFDEVMGDTAVVEECKVWLLKQKQTQDWKTTKATADAVYALLLRGTNQLASTELVQVQLGERSIEPEAVEAGTGFFEQRFRGAEIVPEMGRITVRKVDEGVGWGSVHWQYLEDISKVTPYAGTPLKLEKQLFVKQLTDRGPVLQPVSGPIRVGDELVVRIVLRVDRDMEYVHLKDHRGSGTEPVNVLSQYKYQDGLAYYESTRDTASHFFIDYLPKGTYVFEYSTRVVHRGQYQTGMAQIQCMYAPEFNSHSASHPLRVE